MNDQTDSQLLRAYAEHRSEPAFAHSGGVLACRRAGASRPAEIISRKPSALESFVSPQTLASPFRAAGRAPSCIFLFVLLGGLAKVSQAGVAFPPAGGKATVCAGELIAEGVLLVEMGATAKNLALTVHPHPTLSETLMEAAEVFYGHATHTLPRPKPAKQD